MAGFLFEMSYDGLRVHGGIEESFRVASPKVLRSSVVALRCQVDRSMRLTAGGTGGRFGALPKRNGGAFLSFSKSQDARKTRAKTAMGVSPLSGGAPRRTVAEIQLEMEDFINSSQNESGFGYHRGLDYETHDHRHDRLTLSPSPRKARAPSSSSVKNNNSTSTGEQQHCDQRGEQQGQGNAHRAAQNHAPSSSSTLAAGSMSGSRGGGAEVGPLDLNSLAVGGGDAEEQQVRPKTSYNEFQMSHQFDHLLPTSNSRRKEKKTAELLWQTKKMLPYGVHHSNQIEREAVEVFGEGSDARRDLTRPGKFVEANSFEVRLAELQMKAQWILEQPPAKDSKTRFNAYMTAGLFQLLSDLAPQLGPFGSVLKHIQDELRPFIFSDQPQAMDMPGINQDLEEMMGYAPWIEVVEMQKREADRVAATLTSASMLTTKAARDVDKCVPRILPNPRSPPSRSPSPSPLPSPLVVIIVVVVAIGIANFSIPNRPGTSWRTSSLAERCLHSTTRSRT